MAKPTTVSDFIAQLPDDRRREVERVHALLRKHVPKGYEETLTSGMIAYSVPLSVYPDTYNKQALWYVALAAQKNYLSLHLLPVYMNKPLEEKLRDGFKAAGKKLDMGKGCVRFKRADDLALDTIAEIVAAVPMEKFVAIAKAVRAERKK
jgi:hypothetical protein